MFILNYKKYGKTWKRKVKEIMRKKLFKVKTTDSVKKVLKTFAAYNINLVPVFSNDKFVGEIYKTDLLKLVVDVDKISRRKVLRFGYKLDFGYFAKTADDMMTPHTQKVKADELVEDVAWKMLRNNRRGMPVVNDKGNIIGVISVHRIMQHLLKEVKKIMTIIFDIIIALLLAKILGGFFYRFKLVELLGAIVAGMLIGPIFHIVSIEHIEPFGKIGLMLILFFAGFEFRIADVIKEKVGILSTGILGGLIPFFLGWILGLIFGMPNEQALFIGCIFAATSVSISVGTLISERKINTKLGRYVLTSSIIDDIVGLFILIFVVSYVATKSIDLMQTVLLFGKIFLFAIAAVVFLYLIPYLFKKIKYFRAEQIEISLAIVFILFLSLLSEYLGFSAIIGAFLAGMILARVNVLREQISTIKFEAISFGFFVPFFFVWVGMQLIFSFELLSVFMLLFLLFAMGGKILAAFISGWLAKMKNKEKLALGIARMARGEVALSVLIIGRELGAVNDLVFGSTFMLILVTVILTPTLLRPLLKNAK